MARNLDVSECDEALFQKMGTLLDNCSSARGCEGCIGFPECIRAWDQWIASFTVRSGATLGRRVTFVERLVNVFGVVYNKHLMFSR